MIQTCRVEIGFVADVARAVLEAEKVARRRLPLSRGRTSEAEDGPARGGRAGLLGDAREVADRVVGDLRIVRAGLQGNVPSGQFRLQGVAGQTMQLAQERRPPVGEAVGIGEDIRPQANGYGQRCGPEIEGLAGIETNALPALRLDTPDRLALHHLGDRRRPPGEQHLQV